MKTENTRSRAGVHIPEFRREPPCCFFSGEDAVVQDFQQAAVIVGSGSVRECLFRGQAGIPQKEA